MAVKKPCPHTKWRVKRTKKGVYRICRNRNCKLKILMLPGGGGGYKSPLEIEYKKKRPKGKHRSTFEREENNIF